jgi:ABC-2 type transport system ATP-binding protein
MIEVRQLTKQFGTKVAVDDLSFTVRPGVVTGFLGPNGAGKSTTMRVVLGLDRPTSGDVTVHGTRYARLPAPLRAVGAILDSEAVHPSRTAYNHLLCLAQSNGIPSSRIPDVLAMVELEDVSGQRVGTFSKGMKQRLGIAAALLGDPAVLLFDEPVNGLDPKGIQWIRHLMQRYAKEGRTVLVSSHLMSEMALTADQLIVINQGRLVADTSMADLIEAGSGQTVLVRTRFTDEFSRVLVAAGANVVNQPPDTLLVSHMTSAEVGQLAAADGVALTELTPQRISLEEAFMRMTGESIELRVEQGMDR